ncbi:2Fe-2S iron-sulfur cluster-binding protein [Fodinicurvata halophila]|uniref:2Fe-2S iron-sulfur cluster-binding protein n=1 Tax=Fodinicurvata halophila TaxID=1419723 RepID=UPI0036457326
MTAKRLSTGAQGSPSKSLSFTFDGRSLSGRSGDTVASALLANGIRILGRSFKYHRPRGLWGSGAEEPNAIVDITLDGERHPNARATTVPLAEGMEVRSINASPNAEKDRYALLDRFSRFLPAGFYYKTFLWPDWHLFEPRIRAMAGLGQLDPETQPPADCPQRSAHCDLLVIGAGPAGLAAAQAAALEGREVMLVDEQERPGGSLLHRGGRIDEQDGSNWLNSTLDVLETRNVTRLCSTTAYGIYDHNLVCLWQRRSDRADRLWRVRPQQIVIATGAIERPLVFTNNDRPGIMSADAALFYLRRHDILVGERIVIATNNDSAYPVAAALAQAGAEVVLADSRQAPQMPIPEGVEVLPDRAVQQVQGQQVVEAVVLNDQRRQADCLLVAGGYTPSVHLYCQAKGRLRYDEDILAFVPEEMPAGITVAGAANGAFDLANVLKQGHAAGSGKGETPRATDGLSSYGIEPAWPDPTSQGRQWIDFQNDVTVKDVALAARENYRSVEHLKRYTTLGMATDQGKTSNMNGLAAMAAVTGRTIPEVGTTTYRPPYVPVPLPVIAGRRRAELFSPMRRLVLENEHRAADAAFREYGPWLRPAFYGTGEAQQEIQREARKARQTLGLFDGSPLGKIEVMGPEAAALMDFNSYNTLSTLKPGRVRYGFMLNEDGVVYDDGVVMRLAEDHFIVSCSSGHVPGVVMRLEEWRQDRFDPARVVIHNSTPEWATLTATGPRAKELVANLELGIDLSDETLPHMSFLNGMFEGIGVRVARVSFTGDRSYEITLPASRAAALWARMRSEGDKLDATLLGTEGLMILRAEKGFIVAGKDTDGYTMPMDLGMSGPRNKRTNEYVGKRSLFTEEAERSDRPALVGLKVEGDTPWLQVPMPWRMARRERARWAS